jgi:nitrogenase molybdenum-iron protein alpha/beta subunit
MTYLILKRKFFSVTVHVHSSDTCEGDIVKGKGEEELKCLFDYFNKYQMKVLLRKLHY